MKLSVRRLLQLAALCTVLTVFCIIVIDAPLAKLIADRADPRVGDAIIWVFDWPALFWLHKWGSLLVLGIVVIALLLSPKHRHRSPQLLALVALHVGCRLVVNQIKGATGRLRPSAWLKAGAGDMFFSSKASAVGFPSGHTTQFASFLLPLASFFALPRWASRACVVVPFIVGTGRILQNAHFGSDVTAAMAVCALLTAGTKVLGPWLTQRVAKIGP